ncbi:MAG: sigma-70 family RNA polymerase sigma factor [Calditrichaeota bacterium]|nr:sigma-70 family RNA polymerase sigma factor [Calditrichota bacterium]
MTEEELVSALKAGNKAAFKDVIKQYESLVAATTISMLGRTVEAEDIGQETFIQFYKYIDNFRGDSSIGTYLTRIAMNLSLNELKRRKRRRFFFKDTEEEFIDPANPVKGMEDRELVHKAMQQLDEKYKSVITLRLIDGLSTRQTSEHLNLPEGTILSRLARGQEKLRHIIDSLR